MQVALENFSDICRSRGIKATHQRLEILRALAEMEDHPNAEKIFEVVRERLPTISLDTVYRTLRMFEDKGLISRVGPIGDSARFDANTDKHHHFVCKECGNIRDFYSAELDKVQLPRDAQAIGDVESSHVELHGICSKCRVPSSSRPD